MIFVHLMSPLSISAFNSETGMLQFREMCWTKDPEEVKIGDSDVRNEGGSLIFFLLCASSCRKS